jgi:DNA-binding response OmpR family regulator
MAKCVLVVEDDALICWALEREFSTRGLIVDNASSGAEALEKVRREAYQLAFVDVHLPDVDGVDLIAPMLEISPRVKIVILGCEGRPDRKKTAFDRGAWQYVEKPFQLAEILGLTNRVFRSHTERREHDRLLCRLPVRLTLVSHVARDAALDLRNLSATAVEVSGGGLRLRTAYTLRVGQRVRTAALSDEDPCARHLRSGELAEVVWLRRGNTESEAGLRYVSEVTPDRTS